jgi:hypothetical protein
VPSVSTSEHQPTLSAFSSSIDDGVGLPGLNGQGASRRGGLLRFTKPTAGGDERSPMDRYGSGIEALFFAGGPKCAFSDWLWLGHSR